jgi:hypothetical protein
MSDTPTPQSPAQQTAVPLFGARRMAERLLQENAAQSRELERLRDVVQRFAIADVVERMVALEDLRAEQAVQEARLRELLEAVRRAERRAGGGVEALAQR